MGYNRSGQKWENRGSGRHDNRNGSKYGRDQEKQQCIECVNNLIDYVNKKGDVDIDTLTNLFKMDGIAFKLADYMKDNVRAHQLRRFYDPVVYAYERMSAVGTSNKVADTMNSLKIQLIKLIPQSYYAKMRIKKIGPLSDLIDRGVNSVVGTRQASDFKTKLERFRDVLEAVIAYHKEKRSQGD